MALSGMAGGHSTKHHPKEIKEKARDLYLQGFRPEAISRNIGIKEKTLQTWIHLGKWRDCRLELTQELQEAGEKPLAFKLQQDSNCVRKNLSKYLVESSKKLPRISSSSAIFKENQLGINALTKNAAIVYSWAESTTNVNVHVAMVDGLGAGHAQKCKVIEAELVEQSILKDQEAPKD